MRSVIDRVAHMEKAFGTGDTTLPNRRSNGKKSRGDMNPTSNLRTAIGHRRGTIRLSTSITRGQVSGLVLVAFFPKNSGWTDA